MIWWILAGMAEFLALLACVAIYVGTTTATKPEHKKPKPEVITVEVFIAQATKTHAKGRHKASKARRALAA